VFKNYTGMKKILTKNVTFAYGTLTFVFEVGIVTDIGYLVKLKRRGKI
jgi:hypothetical protein